MKIKKYKMLPNKFLFEQNEQNQDIRRFFEKKIGEKALLKYILLHFFLDVLVL